MALCAGQVFLSMQIVGASCLRVAVRVAAETGLVDFWICRAALEKNDMASISGIDVCLSRAVAGFTGTIFPTLIFLHIKYLMRVSRELRHLTLVARGAGG